MSASKKKKRKNTSLPQQVYPAKKSTVNKSFLQPSILKPEKSIRYSLIITGIFLIIAGFGLLHHEMWRDEHQAWLVARDAHSIPQLFQNVKYEGNPALWHVFLYFITCFTHNPIYMQVFHLLIAGGFIYVFNRYAPVSVPLKILFTFGYFPLYEYAIISRSYSLGLLLVFIVCTLYKNRSSNYIWLGIILGLLANVTIYSLIISLSIGGVLFFDYFLYQKKDKISLFKLVAGFSIFLFFVFLSIYQIWPEKDNSFPAIYATKAFDLPRWGFVASRFFTTYFYIPDISGTNFWNTNIYLTDYVNIQPDFWQWLNDNPSYLWGWVVMPVLLFITGIIIFLRKPLILLLYIGATITLMFLYYYTLLVYSRYCGHLFIILIICYWLAEYYPEKEYDNVVLRFLSRSGKKIGKSFLALILLFNMIGGIVAYSIDYNNKFSPSKDAANYIRENKLDTLTITGTTDFILSPLSSYLDTKLYYPEMNDFGSFTIWSKKRTDSLDFQQLMRSVLLLMSKNRTKLLLVKTDLPKITADGKNFIPLEKAMISKDVKLDLIEKFDEGIVNDEKYYIYLVQKTDSTKVDFLKYPRIY